MTEHSPFRIALIGASGRMGQSILKCMEQNPMYDLSIAVTSVQTQGSAFTWRKQKYTYQPKEAAFDADIMIDFSHHSASHSYLGLAQEKKIPYISGVTGFATDPQDFFKDFKEDIPIFHSANMSDTINLIAHLLSPLSCHFPQPYSVDIFERHHKFKKDAPSGTALLFGKSIQEAYPQDIHYHHARSGLTVGEHSITFASDDETLVIQHKAHNREIFAKGALSIVPWLVQKKPGFYTFKDIWKDKIKTL